MFGLFRTEKNPKGPDIKRLQHLNFDLVDSRLSLSLPYSNDTFLERNHEVKQSINIYNSDLYKLDDIDDTCSYHTLLSRYYEYSRFNHRGYGNIRFDLVVYRINPVPSLFDNASLKNIVKSYVGKRNDAWNNKEDIDEDCKFSISQDYKFGLIGSNEYLSYGKSRMHDRVPRLNYMMAISPHHYVTFFFKYHTVRNTEEVWYQMAKAIEHQILSSVKLELNDELQAEKDSANKG